MKLPFTLALAAVLGIGALLPTNAEAKSSHGKSKSSYHHRHHDHHHRHSYVVRVWVRGHFVWKHGHRHWVPGHYEYRRVYR